MSNKTLCLPTARVLSLIYQLTVYHGHVLLPLLLGNERLVWSVAQVNASWIMSKSAWVNEFAWLNTQRHIAAISGIKLLHYAVWIIHVCTDAYISTFHSISPECEPYHMNCVDYSCMKLCQIGQSGHLRKWLYIRTFSFKVGNWNMY
jgi:hypothetical protein